MATVLDTTTEADLIAAAKAGNAEAFGGLYDFYIKKIYDFIYYKTLNQEVAEDLASTTFVKAWRNLAQFKSGRLGAWLYTIARNTVSDYYRQRREHLDIDDCWDLSDGQDFLGNIDKDLHLERLREHFSTLRAQDREILIMRFWQDLSFAEIAERLEKNEGAVKMACSRALQNLKTKMPLAVFILLPELINICRRTN